MSIFFQNLVFPNPNPNPKGFDWLLESFKKKAKKINCEMTNHVIKPPPFLKNFRENQTFFTWVIFLIVCSC